MDQEKELAQKDQESGPPVSRPPESGPAKKPPQKGPIAFMVRNPVAANLMMFVLIVGGLLGLSRVKQEVFPEFNLDAVSVSVASASS